ncbi:hypothetical protein BH10ACI3_BH10ACI3_03660 [soil metagenome]
MNFLKKTLISKLLCAAFGLFCLGTEVGAQSGGFQDPNINGNVNSIALQPDGKIIIGGTFSSVGGQPRTFVARVNSGGTLDTTFQNPAFNFQGVFVVAIQLDGKILAGGDFRYNGQPDAVNLARFNQDGTRDVTFNAVTNGIVWSVVPQSDGKILIGGEFVTVSGQTRNRMARLNSDGSLDATFLDPGLISTLGIPAVVYAIAPLVGGKVIVGGYFNMVGDQPRIAIVRLNSDGSLDSGFQDPTASGGTGTTINHYGTETVVNSLAVQADSKLVIGGAFNTISGQARSNLARLNSDGSLDASFQDPVITNIANTFLRGAALQPDGRVLIVGFFNSVGAQPRAKAARVNPDGTLDTTFVDPMVSDGFMQSVVPQPNGNVLIGGAFSTVQGRTRRRLTRLTSSGNLDLPGDLTFTVTKTADTNDGSCDADCSLREAIGAANISESNDTIQFDPIVFDTARTIALTGGQLPVCNNGSVTVNGTGSGQLVISGNNQSRVMRVFPGGSATLNDLTIADGNATFGPFTGCSSGPGVDASFGGGGIESAGTLIINNSVVRNNFVIGSAGGISNSYGKITITNSSIRNNRASSSYGGIANFGFGTSLPVTVTILNSQITNNEALGANSDGGGGLGNGGRGTMTLDNSTVSNNTSAASGGGIRNANSVLLITNSAISNNKAAGGAGIANSDSGTIAIADSTINANTSSGNGGGIRNFGSVITFTNSTISENSATSGGGIYGGPLELLNSTIAFNQANSCGGICSNGTTSRNSIIGSNVANTAPDVSGMLTSQGYNLIGNTSGMTIDGGPEDILDVNPRLGPLAANGGPTLTNALLAGSPAMDKGSAVTGLAMDQRGQPRPVDRTSVPNAPGGDGSDIGAFEAPTSAPFDYDADGKSDVSVFRPSNGLWYLDRSTAGGFVLQLGNDADKIAPADYDGDGKTDVAVYRQASGAWYIYNSATSTYTTTGFGIAEDLPAPGDYDGDGKADIAIYRPSTGTWWLNRSTAGLTAIQFGLTGDIPVPGDFDGDGKADLVVYRPSNGVWYMQRSTAGSYAIQFGNSTDKIVPADYDGDGKIDVAIYRPSQTTWYIVNSSNGQYPVQVFGLSTDIPTPGDYDGDGKADVAIFRPSNGQWWLNRTTSGLTVTQFGSTGDKPTPNAFGN